MMPTPVRARRFWLRPKRRASMNSIANAALAWRRSVTRHSLSDIHGGGESAPNREQMAERLKIIHGDP